MLTMRVLENRSETGRIHFDHDRLKRLSHLNASVIDISSQFARERGRTEAFIEGLYAQSYGACMSVSYPTLMSVRDGEDKILAATGFRYADREKLFLEYYTDAPIEQVLSERYAISVTRSQIAEIGNLASIGEASVFLFAALSAYLGARGIEYATITGTRALQRRFRTRGLQPQVICDADASRLPPGQKERWGTYYDTRPRVLAGSVAQGVRHLHGALGTVYEENSPALYSRLHYGVSP